MTIYPARAAEKSSLGPRCGEQRLSKDHASEGESRHLDSIPFETTPVARVSRTKCSDYGVFTVDVPWAEPHGRFSRMFQPFAIRVLEIGPERTLESTGELWNALTEAQETSVEAAVLNIRPAFLTSAAKHVPEAVVVHDRFHLSKPPEKPSIKSGELSTRSQAVRG